MATLALSCKTLARPPALCRNSIHGIRIITHVTRGWKIDLPGDKDPYNTELGVYHNNPSALHFPPLRKGTLNFVNETEHPGKVGYWDATHADPQFLLLVSMTHYLTFVTQFAVALAYFSSPIAQQHAGIPFLLVVGPLFQAMGGAGPNVMHEYEGFQVTPFAAYPSKNPQTDILDYNNDSLRQAAYRALFQLQAVGASMVGIGALWPSSWPTAYAWGTLGVLGLGAYFVPRDVKYWRFPAGKVELMLPPLPFWPLVLFGVGVVLELSGLIHLFGWWGVAITLLLAFGGLLEAGLAEGTYDQRWHLFAVILLNGGGWLQVAALNDLCSQPAFQATTGAVVLGAAAIMLQSGGMISDLYKKLTTDPPLKQ